MSTPPNNPFDSSGNQLDPPPKKKRNTLLWVFAIVGGLGLLSAVACCGIIGFGTWFGMGQLKKMVQTELGSNPIVQEKIGNIESLDINLTATADEQRDGGGGDNLVVFDVQGSKGPAQIALRATNDGVGSAVLIMPDGERHDLVTSDSLEFNPDDVTVPEMDESAADLSDEVEVSEDSDVTTNSDDPAAVQP